MSLIDFRMQRYPPSTQALAALILTLRSFQSVGPYSQMGLGPKEEALSILISGEALKNYSEFEQVPNGLSLDLNCCINDMQELKPMIMNGASLKALRNKYGHHSMACIHPLLGLTINYPPEQEELVVQENPLPAEPRDSIN
jgi:hypothetical protein